MQKRIKIHLGDYEELPYIKGIHCRVLVDGCHSYHTNKMPLCALFHNGYDGTKDIWEPLTVCENPTLLRDTTLNIPLSTFNNLCCFVADNATLLKDFADGIGLQLTNGEDILNESVMPNDTKVALFSERNMAIPRKEQGITKYKDIMNSDYCLVVDISNGLINVAEKVNTNTPLSDVWFEELTGVIPYGGDIHVFGKSGDNDYRFDCQERMITKLS